MVGALRLLVTVDDERILAPCKCPNILRESLIVEMVEAHTVCFAMGKTAGSGSNFSFMKSLSHGLVGIRRMKMPSGIDIKPNARDIPHSSPPMWVTWNAAPPKKMINTCPTISTTVIRNGTEEDVIQY
jgi:hypothetical protein